KTSCCSIRPVQQNFAAHADGEGQKRGNNCWSSQPELNAWAGILSIFNDISLRCCLNSNRCAFLRKLWVARDATADGGCFAIRILSRAWFRCCLGAISPEHALPNFEHGQQGNEGDDQHRNQRVDFSCFPRSQQQGELCDES